MRCFVPYLVALSGCASLAVAAAWEQNHSLTPASAPAAQAAPAAETAPVVTPEQFAANVLRKPVTPAAAAQGRATVRHEKRKGERSKLYHCFTFADGTQ